MEWLVLTIAAWIVEKTLDALLERWKRRHAANLTDTQVLAYHRSRFRTMAFLAVWCALMLTGVLVTAPPERDVLWYAGVAFIAAAGI